MRRPQKNTFALLLLSALLSGGCDSIEKAKSAMRGEAAGNAGLKLSVKPNRGLRVELSAELIAEETPYVSNTLVPGQFVLRVSAPGYQAFESPVTLIDDRTLELSVELEKQAASSETTESKDKDLRPSEPPESPRPE